MFVLAFVFIGLAFFGDTMSMSVPGSGVKAMTSKQGSYSQKEFAKLGRAGAQLSMNLPSLSLLATTLQTAPTTDNPFAAFFANRIILRDEATKLGLVPSRTQIDNEILSMPEFQNEEKFDKEAYTRFISKQIGRFGMTEGDFLDLIKDKMSFDRIVALLTSGVTIDEQFSGFLFDSYMQNMNLDVATLNLDKFIKNEDVSNDILKPFWETQKSKYLSDETRSVVLYTFTPTTPIEKKEGGPAIPQASQKTGEIVETIWEEVINKRKGAELDIVVQETSEAQKDLLSFKKDILSDISLQELPESLKEEFNKAAGQEGSLAEAIFSIAPNGSLIDNISNVLILENGKVVLFAVTSIKPAIPLEFDKARPLALADYQKEQATLALDEAAKNLHDRLVANPTEFATRATKANASVSKLNNVNYINALTNETDNVDLFKAARLINPGQISSVIDQNDKRTIVHLTRNTIEDNPQTAAQRTAFKSGKNRENSSLIFQDWFNTHFHNRDIKFHKDIDKLSEL